MSSIVKAKCPNCKHEVSVAEDQSALPVACESCQASFVPAVVIAESNKRFEFAMYVGMFVIGLGLIGYMAATGQLKPKPDPPAIVEPNQ